jgi:hypothetical protein
MRAGTALKVLTSVVLISASALLPAAISGMQGTPKPAVTVYKSPT